MKPELLGLQSIPHHTWRERVITVGLGAALIFIMTQPAFQAFFFSESFEYYGDYRRYDSNFWRAFFSPTNSIFYRPVYFTASLPWHFILPLDPWLFHLRNYGLTIVNLALLHSVLLRLVTSPYARVLGVLFFAVSKVHLTTIGYINIYDSIVLLLLLLSMVLFTLRALQQWSWVDYALSLLFGGLVIFTKDHGPTVLILLAALLLAVGGANRLRQHALYMAPFIGVAALYIFVRLVIVTPQAPPPDSVYAPRVDPRLIAAKALLFTSTLSNTSITNNGTSGASGLGTLVDPMLRWAGLKPLAGLSWVDMAFYALVMFLCVATLWQSWPPDRLMLFALVWVALYLAPTALIANFQIYHHYEAIAGAAVLLAVCFARLNRHWLIRWAVAISLIGLSGVISNYASRYAWQHVADSARRAYNHSLAIVGDRHVESLTFVTQLDEFWGYVLVGSNYPLLPELLRQPNLKVSVVPASGDVAAALRRSNETNLVIDIDAEFAVVSSETLPAAQSNVSEVIQLHPPRTRAGQGYNVQPNGQSAIGIETHNATPDTVIIFGTTKLETVYVNPALVTAIVPAELYAQPGLYDVYLKNSLGESNRVRFTVEP